MKALTFSEYYDLRLADRHQLSIYLNIPKNNNNVLEDYFQFLSQPFRPEMIEQLFEGFVMTKQIDRPEYYYFENRKPEGVIIITMTHCRTYDIYVPNPLWHRTYDYPKILDHFLIDCQRAGIELTFKEVK